LKTLAGRDPTSKSEITLKKMLGFTLMEMLITMAIAAILLGIGIPSFRYITNSNRIAGEVNGLLGDMQYARAEAMKEGRTVTVCTSGDGTQCSGANVVNWQSGWIVFSNPNSNATVDANETILRVQTPFSSTDTFLANNNIGLVTFNREGYAIGIPNGTLISLHDATAATNWTRCLYINLVGLLVTQKYGDITNGVTCT
jgi:type IV fimbrial biogenesis protein FimT